VNLFLQPIRDVECQLRTWDLDLMTKYAKQIPQNGCFVEIGTKYGGTAYLTRYHSDPSVEVYSVDPNAMLYMFQGKENEVGINWIKNRSTDEAKKWTKEIDLLFIDGDHGEGIPTAPSDDFNAWEGFVKKGGIIIMHDYHPDFPAVIKASDDAIKSGKYELIEKPPQIASRQDTDMFIMRKL